jgi:RNA polymerase sigma-70 factor (ECF subfamily)
MSKSADQTTSEGWEGAFHTTHWTHIFAVQSGDERLQHAALEDLLARYWKPVYCSLRSRGHPHQEAKDLTQGFFQEIVLGKGLVEKADRARGRFRTFLLTALDHYSANVQRSQKSRRRAPKGGFVRLGQLTELNIPEPIHRATPVEVFDYAWASTILDQVLAEVAGECGETGNATHWELFRARVLQPIMDNAEAPSLTYLCQKFGISKKGKASKMIMAVKRRFRAVLRRHVRQFVDSDVEVEDEIRHLLTIFSGYGGIS